jgi:glycosyltransferase involved in cell wall biosynthesis
MIKTKKPSAIIYGWDRVGTIVLKSDIYYEEGLFDDVILYSLPYTDDVEKDYSVYETDVIISVGVDITIRSQELLQRYYKYGNSMPDNVIANDIVCQSVFRNCKGVHPKFSIFTPTFKTGERIRRTYQGLKEQTFSDWEWVIVDDSPDDDTWAILQEISESDFRVKPHKIIPTSGGNIGLAKHRAAMLCQGEWLIELDHDDYLMRTCLEESVKASAQFPDAGFMYTDCSELYEDGAFKSYDSDWSGNWYGRSDNRFDFGYAGHTLVNIDGKEYLQHHYPSINPLTIRFNISMPNHARMWRKDVYHSIGGHNTKMPVADDLELIIRTFLATRMIHIKKLLYLQYNNRNSTVDNNAIDINRRARLIRDYYDSAIHGRILEFGKKDWNWIEETQTSYKTMRSYAIPRFYEEEQVMNYIYE